MTKKVERVLRLVVVIMMVAAVCLESMGVSEIITKTPSEAYKQLMYYLRFQEYEEIVEMFDTDADLLSDYSSEAVLYRIYAEGMVSIKNEQFDEAVIAFSNLQELGKGKFPVEGGMNEFEGDDKLPSTVQTADDMLAYVKGRICEQNGDIANAVEYYKSITCMDSTDRWLALKDLVSNDASVSVNIEMKKCEPDSAKLTLSWETSLESASFNLNWMPVGGGRIQSANAVESPFTVEGLLPGTTYAFILEDSISHESIQFTEATKAASSLKGSITPEAKIELWECDAGQAKKYSISMLNERNLLKKTETGEDKLLPIAVDDGFSVGFTSYYLLANLKNCTQKQQSFDWTAILRLNNEGVYSYGEKASLPVTKNSVKMMFNMEKLLQEYFECNDGVWAEDEGTIELYINGMLVGRNNIAVRVY